MLFEVVVALIVGIIIGYLLRSKNSTQCTKPEDCLSTCYEGLCVPAKLKTSSPSA